MVYERLRHDILNGRLEPGRRLRIKALKERYDVGHSPLREALNRLTASGLIDQVDGKGFQVSITSADEL
ncbi:MAG: GntR family transcriptional regulator, partial [Gammaproteobacteria bacterium]|nr:GntR family transcriptional regulator [Gammaproteobacteria bacterium]